MQRVLAYDFFRFVRRPLIGGCEMLLGVLCMAVTSTAFFLFVFFWKLGTELLYVPAQAYGAWWEVIERGSSYAAPLVWVGFHHWLRAHGAMTKGWLTVFQGGARRAPTGVPS
jgi:hypothetical protein